MTPDYLANSEQLREDLDKELNKNVTLGKGVVEEFEGQLKSNKLND